MYLYIFTYACIQAADEIIVIRWGHLSGVTGSIILREAVRARSMFSSQIM